MFLLEIEKGWLVGWLTVEITTVAINKFSYCVVSSVTFQQIYSEF